MLSLWLIAAQRAQILRYITSKAYKIIIGTHAYNTLLWVKPHEKSPSPERNPIGRRTESDRTANAIRSDGERCFKGVHLSPLGFVACQSKKCTNKAILK